MRYEALPAFRRRTQSQIYKFLLGKKVERQARKVVGVLARLRQHGRYLGFKSKGSNVETPLQSKMTSAGGWSDSLRGQQNGEGYRPDGREAGTRRRKLAGYFKAANELRQTYQQNYMQSWGTRDGTNDSVESIPGSGPDGLTVARTGEEEMLLFPSYARRHVKQQVSPVHYQALLNVRGEKRLTTIFSPTLYQAPYKNLLVMEEM